MIRRASFAALVTGLLILAFGAVPRTSAPIKLARHPDYHAGKIAFSYLGDIWTANEDGTAPQRLTRGPLAGPGAWDRPTQERFGAVRSGFSLLGHFPILGPTGPKVGPIGPCIAELDGRLSRT